MRIRFDVYEAVILYPIARIPKAQRAVWERFRLARDIR